MATSNNEWLQIYQNNLTGAPQPTTLRWYDEAVTTTVTTTTTTATSGVSNQLGPRPTNMRRRSRASRKTPTTLLNTDTTNFRAMVQQFTGGGNGGGNGATVAHHQPMSIYNTNSTNFNYHEAGSRIFPAATSGYNVEFRPLPHQQHYTVAAESGGDHQHGFVQRIQEGGMEHSVNFSGESNNGGKNTTCMF